MTTKPTRSATLKDVAERANVSISTASRVLSGGATVRSRLAERVVEAAAELDYRPNLTARSLRRAQSMTFGAVFFKMDGPPAFHALRGLEWEARRHGYATVTADADGDDDRFIELFRRLAERQVDVVFVYRPPAAAGELIEQTALEGTPVVAISQRPRGMAIPLVTNRPTESIDLAVQRLASLGHEHIAYVGGAGEIGDFRTSMLEESTNRLGIRFLVEELPDEEDRDFFRQAPRVVERLEEQRVTGIFARYPYIAGLVNGIHVVGGRIPRDFSVISFGDGEWLQTHRPQIATLSADARLIGEVAARVGLEALAGSMLGRTYQPTDAIWVDRDSVGPSRNGRSRFGRLLGG